MAKTFEQRLDEALRLSDPPDPLYIEMETRLRQIADFLQSQIDPTRAKAQVAVEPGHLINAGQQFNLVVNIPSLNRYREPLLRAYVPPSGKPVMLDLIGDEPETVSTPAELEERVIEFLSRKPIRNMIRTLKEVASNAAAALP
jgi:hypothetical protein